MAAAFIDAPILFRVGRGRGHFSDSSGPDPDGVPKHMPRVLAKLQEIGAYITKCGCGGDALDYNRAVCWPGVW